MTPALYARYSTDRQRETSIADQFALGRARCTRDGWPEPLTFADEETSGSTAVNSRPGGKQLLAAAYAGQFDVLILEGLDRISRDSVDQEQTIRRLEFAGIRIIGLADGYDSKFEDREMFRGMRGVFNQQLLRDIGKKTHRGLSGQIDRGYHAGGLSYGYKSVADGELGHHLVIEPGQAEWVRWIFEKYAAGWSVQQIAHELNVKKVPSPRGGTWAVSAIYGRQDRASGILNNELYIGRYIWNRAQFVKDPDSRKRTRIDRPRTEWKIRPAPDLRIITDDLWERTRARMASPQREGGRGKGARPTTLFGGLLRCAHCGGAVVAVSGVEYGCAARKDRGTAVCQGVRAKRTETDARLLALVRDTMLNPAAIAEMHAQFKAALRAVRSGSAGSREATAKRLRDVDAEIARLVDAIAAVGVSDALAARLKAAEAEKAKLASQAPARPSAAAEQMIEDAMARYKRQILDLQGALRDDVASARALLRELLGEITLTQDGTGVYASIGNPAEAQQVAAGNGEILGLVAGTRYFPRIRLGDSYRIR